MATQPGATFASFDSQRFEKEVAVPVRRFLARAGEGCRVVLFFYGGTVPDAEEVQDDPRREEGLPHHKQTPSSAAALAAFKQEKVSGTIDMLVLTDERSLEAHTPYLTSYLKRDGAADPRIVPLSRLEEVGATAAA